MRKFLTITGNLFKFQMKMICCDIPLLHKEKCPEQVFLYNLICSWMLRQKLKLKVAQGQLTATSHQHTPIQKQLNSKQN